MRGVVGIAIVIIGVAAGVALSAMAQRERDVIDAERRLLSLEMPQVARPSTPGDTRGLPWSTSADVEARRERVAARFWTGEYAQLDIPRDGNGAIAETDPDVLLVEANAMYRRIATGRLDQRSIPQLDTVLDAYADVLKKSSGDPTAAYNYEYIARVRDRAAADKSRDRKAADSRNPPQTIHGEQGAPPPDPDLDILQTLVPKSGDERRQTEEAGKGERRPRKG
jgi:hypothetical protein